MDKKSLCERKNFAEMVTRNDDVKEKTAKPTSLE